MKHVKIGIIKLHSTIDVITNSSTELFATVKGQKEVIEQTIKSIIGEFGCSAVHITVEE